MKGYDLSQRAKRLMELESALEVARQQLKTVRMLNGQKGYSISINGVQVTVADMDPQTYNAKLIRGREMLHLGAIKALQARVDAAEAALSAYQAAVRAEVAA